jgi:hypothetical protein
MQKSPPNIQNQSSKDEMDAFIQEAAELTEIGVNVAYARATKNRESYLKRRARLLEKLPTLSNRSDRLGRKLLDFAKTFQRDEPDDWSIQ